MKGGPYFREQLIKTDAVSLLSLSNGSQANKDVCRGTGDDLKLVLVTLAASVAVEGSQSKLTVRLL